MSITSRAYVNPDDLRKIQAATAQWIATDGFCGNLHIDDIALRLFNGMRRYTPNKIIRLWEDETGTLRGWAMVYPRWDSYEALTHPTERAGALAVEILDWAESETRRWMQQERRASNPISLTLFEDDTTRIDLLVQRGYQRDDTHGIIAQRSLHEPILDTPLPDNFSIRPLAGVHEAQKLADVQNATFGWHWTADEYSRVITSPGYSTDRQMVVVAPDGSFVAFCYLLLDKHNKLAMFEDVGTHPEFRRMGLGGALLYAGMKRMLAAGMDTVLVPYRMSNSAGHALYTSVGFLPKYNLFDYIKAAPI